jgi:Ca2+-binding EF-hand superfamily protein
MFKMIDTDNSGHITFEELKVGLKKVGANLQESEIMALMEAVSTPVPVLRLFNPEQKRNLLRCL